ncbi:MAG: DDE-type integrase/transposase/recombinase, partial [Leptospirales bacterium]
PNLSKRAREHKIYPYLLRNITAQYPHHIWGIDITYIRMPHGWMYLVAIIDWYSRYVVSWALDQTLEMPLCPGCGGSSVFNRFSHHLQQRPGKSFHQ